MNTIMKTGVIVTAMLASMALMTSCSKAPDTSESKAGGEATTTPATKNTKNKGAKKGTKKNVIPKAKSTFIESGNFLNADRNGPDVTLDWLVKAPGDKITQIGILRSATGGIKDRKRVATLEPGATSHKDRLPDENAYSYWLHVETSDGQFQEIGPVRVEADRSGPANYVQSDDKYKIRITRTDDFATLKWDFPDDEYKVIRIIRSSRPLTEPFKKAKQITSVTSTTERKSQYIDALPDFNSEYWYWFRTTTNTGAFVDKGPIKAEYVNQ